MSLSKQRVTAIATCILVGALAANAQADSANSICNTPNIKPATNAECKKSMPLLGGVPQNALPVPCNRLCEVTFPYVDFDRKMHVDGKVVVLDITAENVKKIFDTLFEKKFPINKATTIDHYQWDDNASMNDNNTSAFNPRPVTDGTAWSMHAYGAAIDINPYQNPFVSFDNVSNGLAMISPASAAQESLNRLQFRPGKPDRSGVSEEVIDIFAQNGFLEWGGYWDYPIDYQHFQIGTGTFTRKLAKATPAQAKELFQKYIDYYNACMAKTPAKSTPHDKQRALCVTDAETRSNTMGGTAESSIEG